LFTALPATYLFFFQRPRRHRHPHSFPTRRSSDLSARILILEGAPQILGTFPAPLQHVARESLERLGVEVRTNSIVTTVDNRGVLWRRASQGVGDAVGPERIEAETVLWGAGVAASPLGALLG